jgi:TonB family protein
VQAAGSLSGIVIDPMGGAVPGVTVTLRPVGVAEGDAQTAVTNEIGQYRFTNLPAGLDQLRVTMPGFQPAERTVTLRAGVETEENVRLTLGSMNESITVRNGAGWTQRPDEATLRSRINANPQVSGNYLELARVYYEQGRLADAESMTKLAGETMHAEAASVPPLPPPPPPAPLSSAIASAQPIRIGGAVKEPKKIKDVKPIYPPDALAAGVEGIVIIETTIAADGGVANAQILRSVPALDQAALDAVLQWKYTPTVLDGTPVEVLMTVTVNFTLR